MLSITPESIINLLQSLSPEFVSMLTLLCCYVAIYGFFRYWKDAGIYVYTSVCIIICNIHVLKAADFSWYNEPIAMGTIVYATTFLASDLLTEFYGVEKAKKAVFLSFASSMMFIVLMILVLGYKPINTLNQQDSHFNEAHNAMLTLFTPSLAIIIASFTAYILSQLTDIYVFSKIRKLTKGGKLWLRTILAVSLAALVDSVVFNLLAWRIFAPNPVSWHSLILTYTLGAYILQMLVASLNVPAFYMIIKLLKNNKSTI
ncbi:MAG: queuosine precursor transporter [Alphaproteobacteria bacterium]|nr:queuosine precursor transporter [Alphaproteobacteria bacterium]OJV13214.1 MAG: hypothetical protein BGO27_00215 [Alphaproteobacteria bacterium 33-17]